MSSATESGPSMANHNNNNDKVSTSSKPKAKPPLRPIPAYLAPLRFMGVPASILRWKPRLPSRNWSIFLSLTVSLTSVYLYDRDQSRKIKSKYQSMVSHLAEEKMNTNQWPRKVHVYTSKCPGEDGAEEQVVYFKKYVKPILVAAAIDWDLTNGTRHGGLARELTERIYSRRRQLLGLEPFPVFQSSNSNPPAPSDPEVPPPPFSLTPQEQLQRELDGANVIVGRNTFKEFQWGLRNGWTTPCTKTKMDREDHLARNLAQDGTFDELEKRYEEELMEKKQKENGKSSQPWETVENDGNQEDVFLGEEDGAGAPLPNSRLSTTTTASPMGMKFNLNPAFNPSERLKSNGSSPSSSSNKPGQEENQEILLPPEVMPAQAPLHLIPYQPLHGWRTIPSRLVGFFNHRKRFEEGGREGVRIALSLKETSREISIDPESRPNGDYDENLNQYLSKGWRNADGNWLNEEFKDGVFKVKDAPQGGDLDFNLESEDRIAPYFYKTLSHIQSSREGFHSNLYDRYKAFREINDGLREPHRSEKGPNGKLNVKSIQELKEERLRKEKEWRGEEHGYEIVRNERGVAWSDSFRGALRVGRSWQDLSQEAEAKGEENRQRQNQRWEAIQREDKEMEEKRKQLEKENAD